MAYLAIRTAWSCGLTVRKADLPKVKAYGTDIFNAASNRLYATACSLRMFIGQKDRGELVDRIIEALLKKKLGQDYGKMSEWDYLAAFYSVGALIHEDDRQPWKTWYPYIRDFLVKFQQPEGHWIIEYCLHCKAFSTSLAVLTLQMPGRYLPSTQY
jgi:hypothetical protein